MVLRPETEELSHELRTDPRPQLEPVGNEHAGHAVGRSSVAVVGDGRGALGHFLLALRPGLVGGFVELGFVAGTDRRETTTTQLLGAEGWPLAVVVAIVSRLGWTMLGVFAAATRCTLAGDLLPGLETIPVRQALSLYYSTPELVPGLPADLVVYPEEPESLPVSDLPDLRPSLVLFGGEVVHQA